MGRTLVVAAVLLALAAGADVARADHHDINLPWSDQLPALPVGTGVQPHAAPRCRKPTLSCVTRVVREMRRRWRPLDRRCKHGAVFALTYLRTTEGLLATLRHDPGFFQDRRYLLWEDALFADYYFRAYDAYFRGKGFVPGAWRTAFRADLRGDYNGGHDVLLGMNAHIQRDLPYVLAEEGLRRPNGATRKPDHDRVNRILSHVLDPIQAELARRYDPLFDWSDIRYAPADELGVLEMMKSWREGAWRNAERLLAARTAADRKAVSDSIESYSGTWARSIANGEIPGYRTFRDGYCRSYQARIRRQARRRAARHRHRHHRHH